MNTLSTNQKILISALIGFVIGAGAVLVWNVSQPDSLTTESGLNEQKSPADSQGGNAVADGVNVSDVVPDPVRISGVTDRVDADDQPAGSSAQVSVVVLAEAGWVAIQEDVNGELGNVLGAAWFPAGTASGSVELLRDTVPGNVYHVVLYHDNGNKEFELGVDEKLVDASGISLMDTFRTNPIQ